MRYISFFLTQRQVREQSKTVTRRLGWHWLNAGTLLQPVVKGQGIPKGGKVEKIGGPIRVVSVRREPLRAMHDETIGYGRREAIAEGFPEYTGEQFVAMFCDHNRCLPARFVTRIEFEYTQPRRDRRRWDR